MFFITLKKRQKTRSKKLTFEKDYGLNFVLRLVFEENFKHSKNFYGWNFLIFSRVIRTSENLPGSTKIFRVYLFREIQISQGIRPLFFTPVKKILAWTFPTFVHDSFKLPKKKIEFLREKICPGKCAKFKIIPGKSYLCLWKFLKMYISKAQTTSWNLKNSGWENWLSPVKNPQNWKRRLLSHFLFFWIKRKTALDQ